MMKRQEMDAENTIHAFKASFFCLLPKKHRSEFSLADRLKLLLRIWRGYYFYYMTDGEKLRAYTFIKRNYLHKYAFMKRGDLLINPYFVASEYRGRGLGTKMLKAVLAQLPGGHGTLWAVVKQDNHASIKVLRKLGFRQEGYSMKNGWSHHLTPQTTDLLIFSI